MPPTGATTLHVRTVAEWRAWLARHHGSKYEVWLVFHKPKSGVSSIAYGDAVDEALCFGWVDSLIKRIDDATYARKFTPRRPDSRWSAANRQRYARLEAAGRLTPAGLARAPTSRGYDPRPARPTGVPSYIRKALARRPKAWDTFQRLPPSHRLRYVHWIDSAKWQETKLRRLREATELLAAGKELGLK